MRGSIVHRTKHLLDARISGHKRHSVQVVLFAGCETRSAQSTGKVPADIAQELEVQSETLHQFLLIVRGLTTQTEHPRLASRETIDSIAKAFEFRRRAVSARNVVPAWWIWVTGASGPGIDRDDTPAKKRRQTDVATVRCR